MISVHETEKLRLEEIEKFLLDAKQGSKCASRPANEKRFMVGSSACYASRSTRGRADRRGVCGGATSAK
jgi:hypothetical protein